MGFKMTSTTKHNTNGWIAKYVDRKLSSFDALEQFLLRGVVVNMQRVLATTALCFLATLLTVAALSRDDSIPPATVVLIPSVAAVNGEWIFSIGVPSNKLADTNRRSFHHVSNV